MVPAEEDTCSFVTGTGLADVGPMRGPVRWTMASVSQTNVNVRRFESLSKIAGAGSFILVASDSGKGKGKKTGEADQGGLIRSRLHSPFVLGGDPILGGSGAHAYTVP